MDLGLRDRVALVTGSYRGTGTGIAATLAREGAHVFVHGFTPGQADPVVQQLRDEGLEVSAVHGDILTDEGAQELVEQVRAHCDGVDVLVNNYGVAEGGRWLDTPTEQWAAIYQKNVLSGVRMVQAFSPRMRERGWGRIVWLGTVGSIRPAARMPHYYASKAALPNVCVSLSKELAGSGVTVNLVSPGVIATEEVKQSLLARAREKGLGEDWPAAERLASRELFPNPCGRLAEIDEVASLVAFVVSEPAGYINGANLRIDGGAADVAQ